MDNMPSARPGTVVESFACWQCKARLNLDLKHDNQPSRGTAHHGADRMVDIVVPN